MSPSTRGIAIFIAACLLLTVVTQVIYMATLAEVGIVEGWSLRSTIWTFELLLFSIVAVAGIALASRTSELQLAWSAIAVSGFVNVIQAGIGLSMFLPASEAGKTSHR